MSDSASWRPYQHQAERAHVMPAAKTPVGAGAVSVIGMVLAVLVTLLGVVGIRDALVTAGALSGKPWLQRAVSAADGLRPAAWMVPVGAALVLVGLWLLLAALRPRPRTAVALQARTGVFLRPKDFRRLADTAAEDVDGVVSVKSSATRRKVSVRAVTTGAQGTNDDIRQAVESRLSPLASPPSVHVRTRSEAGPR